MIRNFIFDFDGTLADTSQLIVATMQKSIVECKLPFRSEEEIKATIGVRLEEIPSILWHDKTGIGEWFANVYRKNFERIKEEIKVSLFPNVQETLSVLKEREYGLVIATSRSKRSVIELAEILGIKGYFDFLLGGDNVSEGKPNPESIYIILEKMKWNPSETMMTGDMPVDILMGKNAGIETCGVTYGNSKETDLKEAGTDYIIKDFSEILNII